QRGAAVRRPRGAGGARLRRDRRQRPRRRRGLRAAGRHPAGDRARRRAGTLRATVDWSHNLLAEPERVLLRRLAVFAGGWTLEGAERVGGGDPLEPAAVLDLLSGLIDKSLVVVEGPRYRFLETIRQYAEEKLLAADEAAALRDRHRDHFAALAARHWVEVQAAGTGAAEWMRRVDDDYDNVRAALGWCRTAPDGASAGLRLAAALGWFWLFPALSVA